MKFTQVKWSLLEKVCAHLALLIYGANVPNWLPSIKMLRCTFRHVIILSITYLFVIGLHGNWIRLLAIGPCTAMFTYLQEQHTRHIETHTQIQFFTHLWWDDVSEGILWWLYAEYGERLHRWAELPHLYVRRHKLRQDVHHTRYVHGCNWWLFPFGDSAQ